jgi:hypothetical protein
VERDDRFLPLLGDNADLDLAFLDVKDGIPWVSLGEDLLVLTLLPPSTVWRKTSTSKGCFFLAFATTFRISYSD